MKPYVYTIRHNVHIIDLEATDKKLQEAKKFLETIKKSKGTVLFVGTKRQAKRLVQEAAQKTKMPYVSERWLGGTFTNFKVIQGLTEKLEDLEKEILTTEFEKRPKKERLGVETEIRKLNEKIGGIRTMKKLPDAVFILDVKEERTAVSEANRIGVPIIALIDTDNDPALAQYPIPSNNDSVKSLEFMINEVIKSL